MDITEPHPLQKTLLKRLGYEGPKSFSTLQGDTPSNKVSFHLDKLQEKNLIEKNGGGYQLTARGIEALPYLKVENIERPIVVVDLFLKSKGKVYLEQKDEADSLDATAGYIRPPSTRARKNANLHRRGEALYNRRLDGEPPNLSLQAVFESTTRFPNDAEQDHLLFYLGTHIDAAGDGWYEAGEMNNGEFLPGMQEVTARLLDAEDVVHGIWDLAYSNGEIKLDRLDFLQL